MSFDVKLSARMADDQSIQPEGIVLQLDDQSLYLDFIPGTAGKARYDMVSGTYQIDVKDAVLVPNICVQNNNIGPYVYVATPYRDGVYTIKQLQVGKGQLYGDAMRMVTGLKPGEFVAERVSQLRLQFGPFVYRTNMQGVPYGADGKLITNPQEIQKFIMSTEPIANELRAKMMQAQAGQEKKAEAARQENAAVEEKEVIQSQDAK